MQATELTSQTPHGVQSETLLLLLYNSKKSTTSKNWTHALRITNTLSDISALPVVPQRLCYILITHAIHTNRSTNAKLWALANADVWFGNNPQCSLPTTIILPPFMTTTLTTTFASPLPSAITNGCYPPPSTHMLNCHSKNVEAAPHHQLNELALSVSRCHVTESDMVTKWWTMTVVCCLLFRLTMNMSTSPNLSPWILLMASLQCMTQHHCAQKWQPSPPTTCPPTIYSQISAPPLTNDM